MKKQNQIERKSSSSKANRQPRMRLIPVVNTEYLKTHELIDIADQFNSRELTKEEASRHVIIRLTKMQVMQIQSDEIFWPTLEKFLPIATFAQLMQLRTATPVYWGHIEARFREKHGYEFALHAVIDPTPKECPPRIAAKERNRIAGELRRRGALNRSIDENFLAIMRSRNKAAIRQTIAFIDQLYAVVLRQSAAAV